MHDTLHRLFSFKAWADDQLLTALAGLGDHSPVTALAIKALSHTYVVDRIFAAHLRREAHAYPSANLSEMPTLAALAADIRRSDLEYIDHVSTLDPAQLAESIDFAFTDGAPGRMSREEMLMHVVTHGAGHRGQVSAVMLLHSVPPAKDGFTAYLHEAEAPARRRNCLVASQASLRAGSASRGLPST
ncbi:DinB family protein [Variovorax paradoxus]|uniref:DinB family protein n=1 Tax=Variovorax paradoxus (strain S110) TaxID=543728 RepID=C5D1K1_VARPS|nr:DinB family protein [Variovorax paradoxus]